MIRALGWLLVGGLLGGLGYWYVREHGLPWARTSEPDDEPPAPQPTEPAPPPMARAASPAERSEARCCIPRAEVGTLQLSTIADALARRWPVHSITGVERIRVGDRVALLVEVGSTPSTIARELVTGRVLETVVGGYRVQVEDAPALACRHGLCADATIDLSPAHVLVWSSGTPNPRRPPIAFAPEPDDEGLFVRQIRVGQPFEIVLSQGYERMRWELEPAGAAQLDVLGLGDVARLAFTRGPSSGRVELRLRSENRMDPVELGRWAFQFNPA